MRIIHHRGAVDGAGGEVVHQAQGVPYLVGRKLAQAGQGHFLHLRRRRLPAIIGRQQAFCNQVILAHPQGTERYMPLDNLAGARIHHRIAVGPAAGGAVHPLNHIIANVHRIGIFRKQLHLKRIFIAGRLEGLVPPGGAFQQGGAHRLRGGAVEIIDDRLHRLALLRSGVFLFQAVAGDELLTQRFVDMSGEVEVIGPEKTAAGIELPRTVPRAGQLHE